MMISDLETRQYREVHLKQLLQTGFDFHIFTKKIYWLMICPHLDFCFKIEWNHKAKT